MNVAPNIAITCCIPIPIVRGQESRSSGATTSVGPSVRPSPWTVHRNEPRPLAGRPGACVLMLCLLEAFG